MAFDYTQGQPWLANALAREITVNMGVRPPVPVTAKHVKQAKERLILARQTHLDSLVDKLSEPRVRRVIEPILAGTLPGMADDTFDETFDDDFSYTRDLGLIAQDLPLRVANPIYHEVIARVLSATVEKMVTADPRSFVLPDGRLDIHRLLEEFADFWRLNGEILDARRAYHEAAPHLVFMGFLQRIVNGGGIIEREFAIGRGRIDLMVRWPYPGPDGEQCWQYEAIELKVWRPKEGDSFTDGLLQLDEYLARLDLDHGTLVIFDRRPSAPPPCDRTEFSDEHTPSGRKVTLLRA